MIKENNINDIEGRSYFKKGHNGIMIDKRQVKTMIFMICCYVCVCIFLLIVGGWSTGFGSEIDKQHLRLTAYSFVIGLVTVELWGRLNFKKSTGVFEGNLKDLIYIFSLLGLKLECSAAETKNYYKFKRELLILPKGQYSVKDCDDFCEVTGSKAGMKYLNELIKLKLK